MKLSFLLWLAQILPQPTADPLCLATTVYLEARGRQVIAANIKLVDPIQRAIQSSGYLATFS